jgi:putative hydrolase
LHPIIDVHCHTVASGHAYSTIEELTRTAQTKKLEIIAMTDHSSGMPGGAHHYHFYNLRVLPQIINGVRVLKGVEANIMDFNGRLDVDYGF